MHRSQSALEYMMTYGWAILIIVIVAAVLYSFGIFNPSSSTSVSITGFSGLNVVGGCAPGGALVMQLVNGLGQSINITKINVTGSNGQAGTLNWSSMLLPSSSNKFLIFGACPSSTTNGNSFSDSVTIQYTEPGSVFSGPYFSNGKISGKSATFQPALNNWAFTGGYSLGCCYIGLTMVSFPSTVSINSASCASASCQAFTAVSDMYFNGNTSFQIETDDAMEIFYRPTGSSAWSNVFGGTAWHSQGATVYGPKYIKFTPGVYQVAVDWNNGGGGGGESAFTTNGSELNPFWLVNGYLQNSVPGFSVVSASPLYFMQNPGNGATFGNSGYWT